MKPFFHDYPGRVGSFVAEATYLGQDGRYLERLFEGRVNMAVYFGGQSELRFLPMHIHVHGQTFLLRSTHALRGA